MIPFFMHKLKSFFNWLGAILALWLLLFLIYGWKHTQLMLDFYTGAASTMLKGESPRGVTAMAYPPPLVAAYIPFCEMGDLMQRILALGIMSLLLVFIFATLQKKVVGEQTLLSTILFWFLVALTVGRHVTSPIENYSHDIFIAALVILAIRLWSTRREGQGGVVMGVAAACKATPLLFLPFLFLQRRWKAAIVMSVATAAVFILPDLLFPRSGGTWASYWFSIVTNSLNQVRGTVKVGNWTDWNQLNQSLSGTISRIFSYPDKSNADAVSVCIVELQPATIKKIVFSARIAILGILIWALYKPVKTPIVMRRFCEGSLLVCGMLLLSPMSSKAHFFLLVLPATVIIRYYIWERRDRLILAILIIMFIYGSLSAKDIIGTKAGHAVLATGSVTWCTLLAMLGTWRVMRLRHSSLDSS